MLGDIKLNQFAYKLFISPENTQELALTSDYLFTDYIFFPLKVESRLKFYKTLIYSETSSIPRKRDPSTNLKFYAKCRAKSDVVV